MEEDEDEDEDALAYSFLCPTDAKNKRRNSYLYIHTPN